MLNSALELLGLHPGIPELTEADVQAAWRKVHRELQRRIVVAAAAAASCVAPALVPARALTIIRACT